MNALLEFKVTQGCLMPFRSNMLDSSYSPLYSMNVGLHMDPSEAPLTIDSAAKQSNSDITFRAADQVFL
jgi:hypothetical protein